MMQFVGHGFLITVLLLTFSLEANASDLILPKHVAKARAADRGRQRPGGRRGQPPQAMPAELPADQAGHVADLQRMMEKAEQRIAEHPLPQLHAYANQPLLALRRPQKRARYALDCLVTGFRQPETEAGIVVYGRKGNGKKRLAARLARDAREIRDDGNGMFPHVMVDLGDMERLQLTDPSTMNIAASHYHLQRLKSEGQPFLIFVSEGSELAPAEMDGVRYEAVEKARAQWRAEVTEALQHASAFVYVRTRHKDRIAPDFRDLFQSHQIIQIRNPTKAERAEFFQHFATEEQWKRINIDDLADRTHSFSRAQLLSAIKFAKSINAGKVTRGNLHRGIEQVLHERLEGAPMGFDAATSD